MQATRRQILAIIKERGTATVEDIVSDLETQRDSITAVTVRHHLSKLQEDGLVTPPEMRHRSTPGRPQHVYNLTEQGISYFPNNYQSMTVNLIKQIQRNLPDAQVNVIIEGVADSMASEVPLSGSSMRERLDTAVDYLNTHGYDAHWEVQGGGYILHTSNCPYHDAAHDNDVLCRIDIRLMTRILGAVPRMTSHIAEGGETCSYFIPGER